MNFFTVIDKPAGITSNSALTTVRRFLRIKSAGHTGTLDPFATGVLVVAVGAATKAIQFLDEGIKVYQAKAKLGVTTDSFDCDGRIISQSALPEIESAALERLLDGFVGESEQIPPSFSAIKINGKKLYESARKGELIQAPPRKINIHALSLDLFDPPYISFTVSCSRGTYVRSLAHDIGCKIGCGAHLVSLRRISSGKFSIDDANSLDSFTLPADISLIRKISVNSAVSHIPSMVLDSVYSRRVLEGLVPKNLLISGHIEEGIFRLLNPDGALLAVAEFRLDGEQFSGKLLRVFPELSALQ